MIVTVRRVSGDKWFVFGNHRVVGEVTITDDGEFKGTLDSGITDVFTVVNEVQDLITEELTEESLLMKC